jgi:glycosyltransferase involved in cell wall biosynthesis
VIADNRATISICIPTFNRARCLPRLFESLREISIIHGPKIEICISNNHSTDKTQELINEWEPILKLRAITQLENIGATPNAFAVSNIATGRWILIVGDDDELDSNNFTNLLSLLEGSEESDWIMVGIGDKNGCECLLGGIASGRYDAETFRAIIIRTGLLRFGFIGMHVFPAALQPIFSGLTLTEGQPWPHVALLLRHLQSGAVRVYKAPTVHQAKGGSELFWNAGDWAYANLRKLDIISAVPPKSLQYSYFSYLLVLRELYSISNIKNILLWKAFEPKNYSKRALFAVVSRYRYSGYLAPLTLCHFLFMLTLAVTPKYLLNTIFSLLSGEDKLKKYLKNKEDMAMFDGAKRRF